MCPCGDITPPFESPVQSDVPTVRGTVAAKAPSTSVGGPSTDSTPSLRLDVPMVRGTVALGAPSTLVVGPSTNTPPLRLDVPMIRGTVAPRAPSTLVVGPSTDTQTPPESEGWHADPSPGFRRLMEEFLAGPSSGEEASVPPIQPPHRRRGTSEHPDPQKKIHSPEHVLLECPLTEPYRHLIRDSILGTVNIRNLFYSIKGAESLATFLLRSNSLLRPLPPQPDPP